MMHSERSSSDWADQQPDYRIVGLDPELFRPLFDRGDGDLRQRGARWQKVEACPGAPERVALVDVPVGRDVLLVNYLHHDVNGPFRSRHAIYVWPDAGPRFDRVNELPSTFRYRPLSLRAFDAEGVLVDAEVVRWCGPTDDRRGGAPIEDCLRRMLSLPGVDFLHVHYAAPGCYAARVEVART